MKPSRIEDRLWISKVYCPRVSESGRVGSCLSIFEGVRWLGGICLSRTGLQGSRDNLHQNNLAEWLDRNVVRRLCCFWIESAIVYL